MTLHITFSSDKKQQGHFVLGVLQEKEKPVFKGLSPELPFEKIAKSSGFTAKRGACVTLFEQAGFESLTLVGLGPKETLERPEGLRIGGLLMQHLEGLPLENVSIDLGDLSAELLREVALALLLRSWRFHKYKTEQEKKPRLKKVTFVTSHAKLLDQDFHADQLLAESVLWARGLINEPGNVLYPETFVEEIKKLTSLGLKVEILDERKMEKLRMGALLGVAQGSQAKPYLAVVRWNGGNSGDKPLAFVGKGVTFDTGGISIKPANRMEEMKGDMAGAAVSLGVVRSLAVQKVPLNAVAVVGLVENMPSGKAQRPGDVVYTMSGQTVEVLNTDAEGRLVLADALHYTRVHLDPRVMIDVATLTGAMQIALGPSYAGLFTEDDALARALMDAGNLTGEKLWRMPMCEAFDRAIDGKVADMNNIGTPGFGASSSTAAHFLKRFVGNTPWAHLDIANVDSTTKDRFITTYGSTGYGIRLLNVWAKNQA
jgi:leucyl aminopeptidase